MSNIMHGLAFELFKYVRNKLFSHSLSNIYERIAIGTFKHNTDGADT